ncbi:TPA: hypothetical protein ACOJPH_002342 [Vibrio campbellii]|uniref:hypothetical protein n=1 Tax=Vibrio campbellii TaxID=680 RepID=UPI00390C1B81
MYCVDKAVFQASTGVDFDSDKGIFFRQLAIKSLKAFLADVSEQSLPNKALAHRLKGIASTCGSDKAVKLCKKFEQYDEILDVDRVSIIFSDIALNLIVELE